MAYQIDRYNNTLLTNVEDGTVDQTTDIKLVGKNYAGYGEIQNENFLHLLENFSGTSQPPKAISGQVSLSLLCFISHHFEAPSISRKTFSIKIGFMLLNRRDTGPRSSSINLFCKNFIQVE